MQPYTIFISYRRKDTAPFALLLKYEIEKRLQFVRVLVDVEDIPPGAAFPDRITRMISESHAVIALIGAEWMPPAGAHPDDSDDAQEDWVVEELHQALTLPLGMPEEDRHEQVDRKILPWFVGVPKRFDVYSISPRIAPITSRNAFAIEHATWPKLIGPLLDQFAVACGVKQRPDKDEYPEPRPYKANTQPIPTAELHQILGYEDYAGWYLDNFGTADATYISKIFKFAGFRQATEFMALVSDHVRVLDHHPEWRNVFNQVSVALTTWDARRQVTIYDLNLALFMNKAEQQVKGR